MSLLYPVTCFTTWLVAEPWNRLPIVVVVVVAVVVVFWAAVIVAEFPTTKSELNYVFDIIDNAQCGEVTYKQFIGVLHFDRPTKVRVVLVVVVFDFCSDFVAAI